MLFRKRAQRQGAMLERLQSPQETDYEICVICGVITNVPKSRPLELRSGYLPGAGQLCHECAIKNVNEEQAAMRNGFAYALPLYKKKG